MLRKLVRMVVIGYNLFLILGNGALFIANPRFDANAMVLAMAVLTMLCLY